MTTMSAFVSYQSSFNTALSKFLADPETEADAAKANQRWNVLSKFEINFNHHTRVGFRLLYLIDDPSYISTRSLSKFFCPEIMPKLIELLSNAGSENVALLALVTRLHQTTLRI